MFNWLKKLLGKNAVDNISDDTDDKPVGSDQKFIWCLVGNIVDGHAVGPEKKIVHGTKHFSPNTMVYCFPAQWGDGYENIKVIGRHRKTSRNVFMILPAKHITNWRLKKVYKPQVIKVMQAQNGWTNSDKDKETILEMLKFLPGITTNC